MTNETDPKDSVKRKAAIETPIGDSPPMPRWPLVLFVVAWLGWVGFLAYLAATSPGAGVS